MIDMMRQADLAVELHVLGRDTYERDGEWYSKKGNGRERVVPLYTQDAAEARKAARKITDEGTVMQIPTQAQGPPYTVALRTVKVTRRGRDKSVSRDVVEAVLAEAIVGAVLLAINHPLAEEFGE